MQPKSQEDKLRCGEKTERGGPPLQVPVILQKVSTRLFGGGKERANKCEFVCTNSCSPVWAVQWRRRHNEYAAALGVHKRTGIIAAGWIN